MKVLSLGRVFPEAFFPWHLQSWSVVSALCWVQRWVEKTDMQCMLCPEGLAIILSHLFGFLFTVKVTLPESIGWHLGVSFP